MQHDNEYLAATELTEMDLEGVAAGKEGGGGGVSRGFDNLRKFQDFQARSFRNAGVNPGSSAFERLARRGVDLRGIGINNMRGAGL